jgi:hypothetical protein
MSTRSILKRQKSPRETKNKRVSINTEKNIKIEIERNDSAKKEGLRRNRLASERYNRVRSIEEKEIDKQQKKQLEKKKSVGILAANVARNRLNTGTPELENSSNDDDDDDDDVIVVKKTSTSQSLPTRVSSPSPQKQSTKPSNHNTTRRGPISQVVGSIFKFFRGGNKSRKNRRK